MSGCFGFSRCRIQFIPHDQQRAEHNYSDRSLIEIRQYDFANFTLQALDIDNNKAKIFEIPLKNENQYNYGESNQRPDEIRSKDGTYRLWLNQVSRDGFYKDLRKCFEQQHRMPQSDSDSSESVQNNDTDDTDEDSDFTGGASYVPPPVKPNLSVVSPKDVLLDVHHLAQYIEGGDTRSAARLASDLASKGVRLQAKSSRNERNEKEFTIQVQLDGNEYAVDQHGAQIPVDVFQSTTVRELRAIFELAYHYPPTNQYFFVNGCLACDNSTMQELNVGPGSLFVLFLLTNSKSFKNNGPWQCPECKTNNQQDNVRCRACTAGRRD